MPESRRYRHADPGRGPTRARSQTRTRPRAAQRSSSYDDTSYSRPSQTNEPRSRRSRHHDTDYYHSSPPPSRPSRSKRTTTTTSSLPPPSNRRQQQQRRRRRSSPSPAGDSDSDSDSDSDYHHSDNDNDNDNDKKQLSRERRDQAIKAAVTAGAMEAFRQRKQPGEWMGKKGLRVATAAISAAAIDTAVDKNPRRKGVRKVVGSSLGGLVVDKLASGLGGRG